MTTIILILLFTIVGANDYGMRENDPSNGGIFRCYSCYCPVYGAFDLGLAVSVPLPIVTGIFVLLWFQSRLT